MKTIRKYSVLAGLCTLAALASAQDTEIVINEFLSNPTGTDNDTRSEWIELHNKGNVAVDLTGYKLKSGTTVANDRVVTAGVIIPPKGYLVFAANKEVFLGYNYKRMSRDLVVDLNWPRVSAINNNTPLISLTRPAESTAYITANIAAVPGNDQSVELNSPELPMTSANYTISPILFGTPGRPNSTLNSAGIVITGGVRNIQYPAPTDNIIITATVSATNPNPTISSVELHVDTGSGYVAFPMVNTGGNNYSYTISPLADETLVKHFVKVTDSNGNFITQPPSAAPEAFFVDDSFPTDADLIINEIMFNPISGDNANNSEWIEVYNKRSTPINMSFYMWGNHTETPNARVLPEGFIIPGNGYAILAGRKLLFTSRYPSVTAPIADAAWPETSTLANTNTDQDTPLVHTNAVDWNNTRVPFDVVPFRVVDPWPTSVDGRSIQLKDPSLDNSLGQNWHRTSVVGNETPAAPSNVANVAGWDLY